MPAPVLLIDIPLSAGRTYVPFPEYSEALAASNSASRETLAPGSGRSLAALTIARRRPANLEAGATARWSARRSRRRGGSNVSSSGSSEAWNRSSPSCSGSDVAGRRLLHCLRVLSGVRALRPAAYDALLFVQNAGLLCCLSLRCRRRGGAGVSAGAALSRRSLIPLLRQAYGYWLPMPDLLRDCESSMPKARPCPTPLVKAASARPTHTIRWVTLFPLRGHVTRRRGATELCGCDASVSGQSGYAAGGENAGGRHQDFIQLIDTQTQ